MNEIIEKYKKYRELNQQLFGRLMKSKYLNFDFKLVAKSLEISKNGAIILNNESEYDTVFCYSSMFVLKNGKNYWEQFWDSEEELNEEEELIIEANLNAYFSLFQFTEADSSTNSVFLKDMFSGEDIKIFDVGLSNSNVKDLIMFNGIVTYDDFKITTGGGFVFKSDLIKKILIEKDNYFYKKKIKQTDKENYKFFFHINRKYGIENKLNDL